MSWSSGEPGGMCPGQRAAGQWPEAKPESVAMDLNEPARRRGRGRRGWPGGKMVLDGQGGRGVRKV